MFGQIRVYDLRDVGLVGTTDAARRFVVPGDELLELLFSAFALISAAASAVFARSMQDDPESMSLVPGSSQI
jgi:hypothetical protein